MKKRMWALFFALMMGMTVRSALCEEKKPSITVAVSPGCLTAYEEQTLVRILGDAFDQAEWMPLGSGTQQSLWDFVMTGDVPNIAICTAQEAARLAMEGLIMPLNLGTRACEVAPAVRAACTLDGEWRMAPLFARHRGMAVNRERLFALHLDALTDARKNPWWQPIQLYQVLEEAAIAGGCAMDIWPVSGEEGAAVAAFMQALFGGMLFEQEGRAAANTYTSLEWLGDMADSGFVGLAKSRTQALERFLAGETALLIGVTEEERQAMIRQTHMDLITVPYPSTLGMPVRDAQVIGAVALLSGDEAADALAAEASAWLAQDERADRLFGARGVEEDGAYWLPCPGIDGGDGAMLAIAGEAIDAVMAGEMDVQAALYFVHGAR